MQLGRRGLAATARLSAGHEAAHEAPVAKVADLGDRSFQLFVTLLVVDVAFGHQAPFVVSRV